MRKSVIKYINAALILTIPLYSKFPFIQIPGTFVNIRLEDFILFASIVTYTILFKERIFLLFNKTVFRAILLFLTVGLISLVSGILLTKTVVPHIGFLHWLRRIEYITPFIIGYFAMKNDRKNLEFYFKLILIVVGISFLYAVGQKYFSWPIIITQNQEYSKGIALRWTEGGHINAMFAGHYDLATYLVMVLPMVISTLFIIKGKFSKLLLGIIIFAGLWLLVNAASRISIFSYAISTVLALLIIKKYKEILLVGLVSIVFVGFSSNLLDRYLRVFEVLKINFSQHLYVQEALALSENDITKKEILLPTPTPIPIFEDRSTSIRLNVEWPRAVRAFIKNPLLGTGYSSITLATDNDYLRLLGETGFMGFASFSLIILAILIKVKIFIVKQHDLDKFEIGFLSGYTGALAGILINAIFIDVFEASKFAISFWLFTGYFAGLIETKNE